MNSIFEMEHHSLIKPGAFGKVYLAMHKITRSKVCLNPITAD